MTASRRDYPYARAASAGIATGMRGTMAFTAIAYAARLGNFSLRDHRLDRVLRAKPALPVLGLAALGELVVDKLPMTPSRLEPGPLAGRLVGGGLAGALASRGRGGSPVAGAIVGVAAALTSSWIFNRGRAWVGTRTGIPDPIVAVGEDSLAIAAATFAAAPYRPLAEPR